MTLRVGLIGLGMMGRHHLRNLQNLGGVEVVGVADPQVDEKLLTTDVPVVRSIQDLIAMGLDYCVVAVPTKFHLETGLELAEAGVHALIEKPLAQSAEESRALVKAFSDRNLIGAVGHIERFNPALQELRRRLSSGELGEVYQISTRRQGPFPARISDVGVIKDLASHDIDLTQWIAKSGYQYVSATTVNRSNRAFEDMVSSTGQLESGVIVNNLVNWLTPAKERQIVVTGESGMFVADTLTADLSFYENATVSSEWHGISHFRGVAEGNITRFAIEKHEPLALEHREMRDAVLSGDTSSIVSLEEGHSVLKVCDAMIESAHTNSTIKVGKS